MNENDPNINSPPDQSRLNVYKKNINLPDIAGNFDDLANLQEMKENQKFDYLEKSSRSMITTLANYLHMTNPLDWIFVIFFSGILTLVMFIFDILLAYGLDLRLTICSSEYPFINLIIWVTSAMLLITISTSVGYFISGEADGSGIPEVKTVISGISMYHYFSVEAFIAKIIGLYAGLVGGASVGKVGPFVHISAIVCSRLLKIKLFSKINSSVSNKNSMIAAAAAAGITLALGTPIGGVIFSMEVASSIYLVGNLPKAFTCATLCILVSKLLNATSRNMHLFETPEQLALLHEFPDIFLFIILGLLSGLIGATITTLASKLIFVRRKSTLGFLHNRFYYALISSIVISLISFNVKPLMIFDRYMLSHIFNNKPLRDLPLHYQMVNHPGEGIMLLVLFSFKFFLTLISVAISMPQGIFAPFFLIGAFFGKLFAHVCRYALGEYMSDESIYAMVGAACVMSGATHTISSAIIIFELTGQSGYFIPMLLACLTANLTAQSLSMSYFDLVLLMKNLPHLPSLKSSALYDLTAQSIMSRDMYPMIIHNFNYMNSLQLLNAMPNKCKHAIPLIDSDGIIKYTVRPKKLGKYLFHLFEGYKLNYEDDLHAKLKLVIQFIRRKLGKKYQSFLEYLRYKIGKMCYSQKAREMIKMNKIYEEHQITELLEFLCEYSKTDTLILNSKIDPEDQIVSADKSALTIDSNYPCLKLQFLFTFLNVDAVYVYKNGSLAGLITKEDFVKKAMLID